MGMKLSEAQLGVLSGLLDQALDLSNEAREAWFEGLAEQHAGLKPALRELLARDAQEQTTDLLGTLPSFTIAVAATADETPSFREGGTAGPYRLIRPLGCGGMGAVWLAERIDGLLKRPIALKLPHPGLFRPQLIERFQRERDILASLTHPNIGRLYDAGVTSDGQQFLALEYVEGTSLTDYCDAGRLDIRARLKLFLQVLEAVQYAHSHLVVHRDLKPSNILVTSEGQIRLLDFGIAKLLIDGETQETDLTQLGGRMLTPDYASPEQVAGQPISTTSDVYSLGVVLYELLTGERPYRLRRYRGALEEAILGMDPAKPSQAAISEADADARSTTIKKLPHTLAGDLDTIVLKALKKQPRERYATADAFAQDIERYLTGDVVLARPERHWYRAKKFLRRNRLVVASAALILASLAVGLSLATWEAIEAKQERARAERVKDFIGSILDSANPYVGGKSDVTVRDMLKAGVERVDRELKSEPGVSAELLSLLSSTYLNLGEVDLALTVARKADQLSARAYPEGHPMRGRILRVLGEATEQKGNVEEARKLLEQSVAIERRAGDQSATELARSLVSLSSVTVDKGEEKEAIALDREAVATLMRARGANDPMTIWAVGELSNKLMIGGYATEAMSYAQRAYRSALDVFGDSTNPVVVQQLANYAYAQEANGQYQAARENWQRVVDAKRKTFNPQGPQVAAALVGLGRAEEFMGELKAAIESYTASLQMMKEYAVQGSGEMAIRYYSIGRAALQARQSSLALRSLNEAIAQGAAVYGAQSSRVRDAEYFRAAAALYAGDFDPAERVLDRAIKDNQPGATVSVPMLLRYRALLDRVRGNPSDSLQRMQAAWEILNRSATPARRAMGQTLSELGQAQVQVHRAEDGARSLEQAIPILKEVEPVATPQQADAWIALARARLELGQVDASLQWAEMASRFWNQFDAGSPFAGEAAFWVGTALLKKGNQQEARQQLARSIALLEASPWPSQRQLSAQAARKLQGSKSHT
jgi:eukaryotic-like serine/threonine-protein kinase